MAAPDNWNSAARHPAKPLFETKEQSLIELGPNRHPLVIGEVVYFHVDPACMTNGYIDMRNLAPIGRLNGFQYVTLGDILDRKFDDGQPR